MDYQLPPIGGLECGGLDGHLRHLASKAFENWGSNPKPPSSKPHIFRVPGVSMALKKWVHDPIILGRDQPFLKGQKETPGTQRPASPSSTGQTVSGTGPLRLSRLRPHEVVRHGLGCLRHSKCQVL